ncbi:MAG: hypothetical protein HYV07_25805 [Deltaproteobacteria bacterium]|nr:hypothetical protein [Deltaproteobacteria bacterium]
MTQQVASSVFSTGPWGEDTDPKAQAILVEGYRRMSGSKKLAIVQQLTVAVQELAILDIRRRHPEASEREVKLRLASRWLPVATMRAAFGWDPEIQGY